MSWTTPNIDRLAAEGLKLDNYFAIYLCTPLRGALLTDRSAQQMLVRTQNHHLRRLSWHRKCNQLDIVHVWLESGIQVIQHLHISNTLQKICYAATSSENPSLAANKNLHVGGYTQLLRVFHSNYLLLKLLILTIGILAVYLYITNFSELRRT